MSGRLKRQPAQTERMEKKTTKQQQLTAVSSVRVVTHSSLATCQHHCLRMRRNHLDIDRYHHACGVRAAAGYYYHAVDARARGTLQLDTLFPARTPGPRSFRPAVLLPANTTTTTTVDKCSLVRASSASFVTHPFTESMVSNTTNNNPLATRIETNR